MPVRVAVAFGSNTGDRQGQIRAAIEEIGRTIRLLAVSPVYETAPMYVEDQPPFINGALLADTDLGPFELLKLLKGTEQCVGREQRVRNGPREIDLDLVIYGKLQLSSPGRLQLPHPRLNERRFVLQPLYDLDPSLTIPGLGDINSLLRATEDQAPTVRKMNDAIVSLPVH
jgi:2-amino-4-hydroxy-6-hydroxymethyldihydropteridine diphosphokinase